MGFLKQFFCKKRSQSKDDDIPSQVEIWKFYFRFLKIDMVRCITLNIQLIVSSFIQVRSPFLLLDIKNHLINNDVEQIKYSVIQYIVSMFIVSLLDYIETHLHQKQHQNTIQSIQKQILEHIFSLDISYFEDTKISSITKTIQQGAEQIANEISYGQITSKILEYTYTLGEIYFIYCQSASILIMMLVFGFINAIIYQYISYLKRKVEKEEDKQLEYKNFALDDIMSNIQLIKIFRKEKQEIESLNKVIQQNAVYQQKTEFYNKLRDTIRTSSHEMLKIAIVIQILIIMADSNSSTLANSVSEIINCIYSCLNFTKLFLNLIRNKNENYFESRVRMIGKVMKLFTIKPSIHDDYNEQPIQLLKGNIKFEGVSFKYPISNDTLARMHQKLKQQQNQKDKNNDEEDGSDTASISSDSSDNSDSVQSDDSININQIETQLQRDYVLKNVSFEIKQGQLIAFVGMSGSGKSTLIKLIERYYDIEEGNILFDGNNIKDISLNDLRGSIGLVNQEPSLFDNDIEYNITYGCADGKYTQEELKQICDISGVSEFVFDEKRFPEGLKTLVGSKGIKLSGGQKQRIAIARALIKKPSILILDEATSSLDAESEHLVQKYIDQLVGYRGITIIVIAHRLSTIVKSDVIYVMENGEIKEAGNHTQLIEIDGIYKKLIHYQINFNENIDS